MSEQHGTRQAYYQHKKDHETPCALCKEWWNNVIWARRTRRRLEEKAERNAHIALAVMHPEDYRRLYLQAKERQKLKWEQLRAVERQVNG